MKARLAVGLILLGILIGCSNSGPTAPGNIDLAPPAPAVTPVQTPQPTPTPSRKCVPIGSCHD